MPLEAAVPVAQVYRRPHITVHGRVAGKLGQLGGVGILRVCAWVGGGMIVYLIVSVTRRVRVCWGAFPGFLTLK